MKFNRRKFGVDTISNYLYLILKLSIGFFTIPVMLNVYGEDLYGVYLLSFGLVGMVSFLDFGSRISLSRFSAEYLEDRNKEKYADAFRYSFSMHCYGTALALLILLGLAFLFPYLFNVPKDLHEIGFALFLLSVVYAVMVFMEKIPSSILEGFHIFHLRNKYRIVLIVFDLIMILLVFLFEISIIWYAILNILNLTIGIFIDIWLLSRKGHFPAISFSFVRPGEILNSAYFKYNRNIFISGVTGVFSQQLDKVILAFFLDVKFLAIYTVITKPYLTFKTFYSQIYKVIQPILSQEAISSVNGLKMRTASFSQITIFLFAPLVLLSSYYLETFIEVWIRTDIYAEYSIWGQVLLLSILVKILSSTIYRAMLYTERTDYVPLIEISTVSANVIVSILLTSRIGIGGVIIGTVTQFLLVVIFVGFKKINMMDLRYSDIFNWGVLLLVPFVISVTFITEYFSDFLVIQSNGINLLVKLIAAMIFIGPVQYFLIMKNLKKQKFNNNKF